MKRLKSVVALAMLLTAGVANAGLYQFDLGGDYTASWRLNSTVAPDLYFPGIYFTLAGVEGNFPESLNNHVDLTFYNDLVRGGLEIYDAQGATLWLVTDGPQLYTGTESAPTFSLGSFGMTEVPGLGSGRYTLTVTDLDAGPGPADVPEPATGAMLLAGLGLLYASRKRRIGK
jgi:hypothetical protein